MKTLERGQDKIQKICDKIRRETLEPAKEEAQSIIAAAKKRVDEIIKEAEHQAEQLIKQAKGKIEQERNVFHSSLQQAAKQTLEGLKQEIESKFFNEELQTVLEKQLANPQLIANLINGLVKAIEKDGMSADLAAVIPHTVSAEEVNALLLDNVRKKLKDGPLEVGSFAGGAQVKLVGRKMTLDLTDQALKELLANYMRKDFRQTIFGHQGNR
jgi:V/A-type H+-transporting ATPase subunit E